MLELCQSPQKPSIALSRKTSYSDEATNTMTDSFLKNALLVFFNPFLKKMPSWYLIAPQDSHSLKHAFLFILFFLDSILTVQFHISCKLVEIYSNSGYICVCVSIYSPPPPCIHVDILVGESTEHLRCFSLRLRKRLVFEPLMLSVEICGLGVVKMMISLSHPNVLVSCTISRKKNFPSPAPWSCRSTEVMAGFWGAGTYY